MNTVTLKFAHHVSRQTKVRSNRSYTGSPVTAIVPFPHHASQQAEIRSNHTHVGSPVTAVVPFPHHASQQVEIRSPRVHTGSPVTTAVAFTLPSILTELRSTYANIGSPVTATFTFAPPLAQTALRWTHSQADSPVTERFVFPKLATQFAAIRWQAERREYTTATIHLRNDYHNLTTTSIGYCYDWKTIVGTALRYKHWSVVKPGWRIVAKNIVTGESIDLGFVDTDNPSLEDVFLPDGDYEISVLTSSLFWKDCLDRTVRTISVRPGDEVTPLPTIYNLRSAVLNGVTTIRWSATQSELGDCVFGVWYGSDSPVDTNRQPDATIWYYASQTEYATIFYQNAPAYVAVALMRNGDEPELGKIHELFLDWSNVPPRRPDDVVLFDKPLPVVDAAVEKRREDDPFLTMWTG